MTLRPSTLTLVAIGIALAGAIFVAVAAARGVAPIEAGHTPFHIGCLHHNHGPRWHQDHGRILGQQGRLGGSTSDEGIEASDAPALRLEQRSVTSGR